MLTCAILSLSPAATRADDPILKNDAGARIKVIVRHPTAIYKTPDRAEPSARPANMFDLYYVARPDAGDARTTNGFYRVATGTSRKYVVGWIPAEDCVEWSHRQVLGLRPIEDRRRAHFYENRADLESAYRPAAAAANRPTPLSLEPESGGGINLIPIMERFRMKVDGAEIDGYRVAYLHSRSGDMGSVDFSKATIDIMFVIDTTNSMGPYIDATRKMIESVVTQLSDKVSVRFGIVGYRDVIAEPQAGWYHTQMICDLRTGADHTAFQRRLAEVKPADQGSGDVPEDVLAGVQLAVEKAGWNPDAFKHVIVIGDASAHTAKQGHKNPDRLTFEGVLARAQPRGAAAVRQKIAIHGVRIVGEYEEDRAIAEEQFKSLATGDGVRGQYHVFDGQNETPAFVAKLVQMIRDSQDGVERVRRGQLPKRDTPGLGLLMQMVKASKGGSDVPQFASGYTSELDHEGNQLFEPYVLVQYGTMDLFDSVLDFAVKAIRRSGDPDSRDVKRVVQQLRNFVAEINLGEQIETMPMRDFLHLVSGLPVQSRIFNYTIKDLVAMPEADFARWVQDVERSKSRVRSHLDNTKIWFSMGSDTVALAMRHAFLKVKDLP